jgi:Flp pilus assembly protein TadG
MRTLLPFVRGELGQSIVELALALPILVFLLIGGADLARAFAIQIAVQNGARAGAEASVVSFTPNDGPIFPEAIKWTKQEMGRTPGMNTTVCSDTGVPNPTCTISVTRKLTDGTTDCPVSGPTLAAPCFFKVRVQYTFRTTINWPMLPNTFNFDRQTLMRAFV